MYVAQAILGMLAEEAQRPGAQYSARYQDFNVPGPGQRRRHVQAVGDDREVPMVQQAEGHLLGRRAGVQRYGADFVADQIRNGPPQAPLDGQVVLVPLLQGKLAGQTVAGDGAAAGAHDQPLAVQRVQIVADGDLRNIELQGQFFHPYLALGLSLAHDFGAPFDQAQHEFPPALFEFPPVEAKS